MTKFFDSEVVKETLYELESLQQKIFTEVFQLPFFTKEQKKEHIQSMKEFLEKQKILIFRMSLSDDPEAIEMKERIIESAKIMGYNEREGLTGFFKKMEDSIENLEKMLDE